MNPRRGDRMASGWPKLAARQTSTAMSVTITAPVTKLCPFKDERDYGTIRIAIDGDEAPELHGLADELAAHGSSKTTHEDFTAAMAYWLTGCGVSSFAVESTWHTAGLEVTCRAVSGERVERTDQASDA